MTRMGLLTAGLVWQFVLVLILFYRDEGNLRWATLRRRLWLRGPSDPKRASAGCRLWLWVIAQGLQFRHKPLTEVSAWLMLGM